MRVKTDLWNNIGLTKQVIERVMFGFGIMFFFNSAWGVLNGLILLPIINFIGVLVTALIITSAEKHTTLQEKYKEIKDGKNN